MGALVLRPNPAWPGIVANRLKQTKTPCQTSTSEAGLRRETLLQHLHRGGAEKHSRQADTCSIQRLAGFVPYSATASSCVFCRHHCGATSASHLWFTWVGHL